MCVKIEIVSPFLLHVGRPAMARIFDLYVKLSNSRVQQLVDGVKVIVPDILECITSYVLYEQEDCFEDEIKYVRNLPAG